MGRTIIITGASSGIGRAFVEMADRDLKNDRVVALTRRRLPYVYAENVTEIICDLTKPEDIIKAVEKVISQFGRIDVLINGAGNGMRGFVSSMMPAEMLIDMEVNVWGALNLQRAVLIHMKHNKSGRIINISSLAASVDYLTIGSYGAAKAFLEKVTRILALEVADAGISVALFIPGAVKSNFGKNMTTSCGYDNRDMTSLRKLWESRFRSLFRRASTPEEASRALMRLVNNKQSLGFVTVRDNIFYRMNQVTGPRFFQKWFMGLHMGGD